MIARDIQPYNHMVTVRNAHDLTGLDDLVDTKSRHNRTKRAKGPGGVGTAGDELLV